MAVFRLGSVVVYFSGRVCIGGMGQDGVWTYTLWFFKCIL